jgi:ribosomal protein S18 acetylase RimI-like enzyme
MSEIDIRRSPIGPADQANPTSAGHNGGPPLDQEHTPEWGSNGIGNYFYWRAAHRRAWKNPSPGIVAFRIKKAERLGLTYEEYTLEILERGRHLQIEDVERIAEIKQRRAARAATDRNTPEGHYIRPEPLFMPDIQIRALHSSPDTCAMLSEMLVEAVANGGSVSFMHPLPLQDAKAFWRDSLGSADRGERIVLGAFDGAELIGTVTLLLKLSQNQPHRAEIAKMLTRLSHRHRGVATALLREAERTAIEHGRWLLVLDTAEDEGAAGLYERVGFQLAGLIPDYAFKPYGGLTGTLIYWKRLQERALA